MAKVLEHKKASSVVIVAVALLTTIASYIVYRYFNHLFSQLMWLLPLFYTAVTVALAIVVSKIKGEDSRKDTNRLMIYKTAKLLVAIAILLIVTFAIDLSKEATRGVMILFFIDYMVLLAFEFLFLRNNEQANKERIAKNSVTK